MRFAILLSSLYFALYACGPAQDIGFSPPSTVTVAGNIRHALLGTPIAARVSIGDAVEETNENGGFTVAGIPKGNQVLLIEAEGFTPLKRNISVSFSDIELDLLLFPVDLTTSSNNDDPSSAGVGSPPNAPLSVAASIVSAFAVHLAWSPAPGAAALAFSIQRSVDGGPFVWLANAGANETSIDDDLVAPNHSYVYRVRAFNNAGSSTSSTSLEVHTPEVSPEAPRNLLASAFTSFEVYLSWADYAVNETGYVVERRVGDGVFENLIFLPANTVEYLDIEVVPGERYVYRVYAINSAGASLQLQAATATPDTAPATPTGLQAVASLSHVALSWADNAGNESGYRIYRGPTLSSQYLVATLPADIETYDDHSIIGGVTYTYRVAAFNGHLETFSAAVTITTALGAPDSPRSLSASPLSAVQVLLTWSHGMTSGTETLVFQAFEDDEFTLVGTLGGTATAYVVGGLLPETTYRWKVQAKNTTGGADSATVTLTTPAGGIDSGSLPAAPAAAFADSSSYYSFDHCRWSTYYYDDNYSKLGLALVAVYWTDDSHDELGFVIEHKIDNVWHIVATTGPNVQDTLIYLPDGQEQEIRVRAYNTAGLSTPSPVVNVTPELLGVECLEAVARGNSGVLLFWTHHGTGEQVVIQRREFDDPFVTIATVNAADEYYHDVTAERLLWYDYRVRVRSDALQSGPTNTSVRNEYWQPIKGGILQYATDDSYFWADTNGWQVDNQIFVGGQSGSIMHFNGLGWSHMDTPTVRGLNGLWASTPDDVWAVGQRGTVLHYDGHSWTKWQVPTRGNLFGIFGFSATDIWAVGEVLLTAGKVHSTVIHWNGSVWEEVEIPFTTDLRKIWGSGPNDVWLGGYGGILHWDGLEWSAHPLPTQGYLWSITGTSATDIFAATGDSVLHYDGTSWTSFWKQEDFTPISVHIGDAGLLYILAFASSSGVVLFEHDGSTAVEVVRGDQYEWTALAGLPGEKPTLIGDESYAYYSSGGEWIADLYLSEVCAYRSVLNREGMLLAYNQELEMCSDISQYFDGYWTSIDPTPIEPTDLAADESTIYIRAPFIEGEPLYYWWDGSTWQSGPAMNETEYFTPSAPSAYEGDTVMRLHERTILSDNVGFIHVSNGQAYILLGETYADVDIYEWDPGTSTYSLASADTGVYSILLIAQGASLTEVPLVNAETLGMTMAGTKIFTRHSGGSYGQFREFSISGDSLQQISTFSPSYYVDWFGADLAGNLHMATTSNALYSREEGVWTFLDYLSGDPEFAPNASGSGIAATEYGDVYLWQGEDLFSWSMDGDLILYNNDTFWSHEEDYSGSWLKRFD